MSFKRIKKSIADTSRGVLRAVFNPVSAYKALGRTGPYLVVVGGLLHSAADAFSRGDHVNGVMSTGAAIYGGYNAYKDHTSEVGEERTPNQP